MYQDLVKHNQIKRCVSDSLSVSHEPFRGCSVH